MLIYDGRCWFTTAKGRYTYSDTDSYAHVCIVTNFFGISVTLSCHCNPVVELSPTRTSTELQANARHYEEHGRHNEAAQIPRTPKSMQKL